MRVAGGVVAGDGPGEAGEPFGQLRGRPGPVRQFGGALLRSGDGLRTGLGDLAWRVGVAVTRAARGAGFERSLGRQGGRVRTQARQGRSARTVGFGACRRWVAAGRWPRRDVRPNRPGRASEVFRQGWRWVVRRCRCGEVGGDLGGTARSGGEALQFGRLGRSGDGQSVVQGVECDLFHVERTGCGRGRARRGGQDGGGASQGAQVGTPVNGGIGASARTGEVTGHGFSGVGARRGTAAPWRPARRRGDAGATLVDVLVGAVNPELKVSCSPTRPTARVPARE